MTHSPEAAGSLLPVAQYLRASTEHQQYSTDNQRQVIAQYALQHRLIVIKTYTDQAKSGLVLKRRHGLQELLRDVVAGARYKAILVYDVSRWGRFLDADESAHYEFLCKSSGAPIHYCAESFGNELTFPNSLMKAIKRTMAGEYSRELSDKVFRGMNRLVQAGFCAGGPATYGLRRFMVAADGTGKQLLGENERKCLASDRVVYVLGPEDEVKVVRNIYRMFVEDRMSYTDIARRLNQDGVPPRRGSSQWNYQLVCRILANPKYVGSMVYNRSTRRLQSSYRALPEGEWVVVPNVFDAIIDKDTYEKAKKTRDAWVWNRSDAELLDQLRVVLRQAGRLSTKVLAGRLDAPSGRVCLTRFGSLKRAYELIGYRAGVIPTIALKERLRTLRNGLLKRLSEQFPRELSIMDRGTHWRSRLRFAGTEISVRVCRSVWCPSKGQSWVIEPLENENQLITLLALMNPCNTECDKLVMVPGIPFPGKYIIGANEQLFRAAVLLADIRQFLSGIERIKEPRNARV